jgi:rare lipoprotein A
MFQSTERMNGVRRQRLALMAVILSFVSACASSPETARRYTGGGASAPISADSRHLIASSSDHQKIGNAYNVGGRRYVPQRDDNYDRTGIASWYGPNFHGRPTANGEVFDQSLMTAAHTTLPIPSIAEVTNLENGRTIIVRVNDRGPFVDDRLIDLSRAAATELGYQARGLARVRVRYLGPAQAHGAAPARQQYAQTDTAAQPTPIVATVPTTIPAVAPIPAAHPPQAEVFEQQPYVAPVTEPAALTLQVGAFSERANAQRFANRLEGAGDVWVQDGQSAGRNIFRVYVGRWPDRTSANQARTLLENWGVYDARIIALN